MKKFLSFAFLTFLITTSICNKTKAQTLPAAMPTLGVTNPWNENQVMEPLVLASIINASKTDQPVILNIGAVDDIRNAKHIGAASKPESLKKLNTETQAIPKNKAVIIYCGCCPFNKCPNIRPAFVTLQEAGFSNIKVLDLPTNLKVDWINKGYPLAANKASE